MVITLTVYWGAEEWDAPRSLYDMFDAKYESILPYVDDYHLHLIIPSEISDFELFRTSLREVLEFIKVSNDETKADELINNKPRYKKKALYNTIKYYLGRKISKINTFLCALSM